MRKRPLPLTRDKIVTATKRLPLWKLSDEMYTHRQIAPNPDGTWTEVRRQQARMRDMVIEQQKTDMKNFERELSGFRLEPRHPLGELRAGMWLDGRISGTTHFGVYVDVGAYTEAGQWIDGFMSMGQIREDGRYIAKEKMMNEVHLGEFVRVRVREVIPASGTLTLSMRTVEDLPPLFLGKPRPYSLYDLEDGMPVTGIVRRVFDKMALVDIGADRLCKLHVRNHPREKTRWGFDNIMRRHKYAYSAYPRGAEMELYIRKVNADELFVELTCVKPRSPLRTVDELLRTRGRDDKGIEPGPRKEERLDKGTAREREMSKKEKEKYEPYVAYVDEWLEDAMEPDEDTDSWIARTENELFQEMQEEDDQFGHEVVDAGVSGSMSTIDEEDEEFADEEFADDEFAEDDFADDSFATGVSEVGFGPNAFPATELDGWVLDETPVNELAAQGDGNDLTEDQIERLFDEDGDEELPFRDSDSRSRYGGSQPPPR